MLLTASKHGRHLDAVFDRIKSAMEAAVNNIDWDDDELVLLR
jgi:hypothetical protein